MTERRRASPPPFFHMEFWSCDPIWAGETAFILAGGASLKSVEISALRGRRVIAVKESALVAPWADIMFYADDVFYQREPGLVDSFAGQVITIAERDRGPRCRLMRTGERSGISSERDTLNGAWTSVHFSLNLLRHLGVACVGLLGVDLTGPRWHDRNPSARRESNLAKERNALASTVAPLAECGIEVFNCTPGGELDLWPRRDLKDLLWRANLSPAT